MFVQSSGLHSSTLTPASSPSDHRKVTARSTPHPLRGSSNQCLTKGLRHFSLCVCKKVEEKGVTTYNEVRFVVLHLFMPLHCECAYPFCWHAFMIRLPMSLSLIWAANFWYCAFYVAAIHASLIFLLICIWISILFLFTVGRPKKHSPKSL